MSADEVVASYVVDTRTADLADEAIAATKQHILHTIATALAGSRAPGVKPLLDLVAESGGAPESTVLVHGNRVPAINAALVNSTMAHAQDYCMNDDRTFYKSSVVVVPVAWAVAERVSRPINGPEFISATCLGIELGIRVGLAINPPPAHALSSMVGGLASTATAARLLGLDQEQTLDALGVAYCQIGASVLFLKCVEELIFENARKYGTICQHICCEFLKQDTRTHLINSF